CVAMLGKAEAGRALVSNRVGEHQLSPRPGTALDPCAASLPARSRPPMPVMSNLWIRRMAENHRIIEPFVEAQKHDGVINYGLSSKGYDARIAHEFKLF